MFGLFKRRRAASPQSRQHPTAAQAFAALSEGRCMYALVNRCSGPPRPVGFGAEKDESAVLVCGAHYGRLRKLDARAAAELERYLSRAFRPREQDEDDVVFVVGRRPS
jgi:hypothetical protein